MKRDLDLATKILLALEAKGIDEVIDGVEGCGVDEFYYNARLLASKNLIEIMDFGDLADKYACDGGLPGVGELLDRRDEGRSHQRSAAALPLHSGLMLKTVKADATIKRLGQPRSPPPTLVESCCATRMRKSVREARLPSVHLRLVNPLPTRDTLPLVHSLRCKCCRPALSCCTGRQLLLPWERRGRR